MMLPQDVALAGRNAESSERSLGEVVREDRGSGRIAAIDGLRAVAVLGVMAFHFGLALGGGFLGVDLFFVISGFVITRMLLAQRARAGAIKLGEFWLARAKRLLPALLTVLVFVQLWMHLGAGYQMQKVANEQTLAALIYGSNWFEIFNEGDIGRQVVHMRHLRICGRLPSRSSSIWFGLSR